MRCSSKIARKSDLAAIHRLHKYFLLWHKFVDAGRDTECSGYIVLDDLRGHFYDHLLRRLRATRRAGSLHARKYRVRAGALLPRHRSRLGNYLYARKAGAFATLLRFPMGIPQIPKATFKALLFTIALYLALHSEFSLLSFCSYCLCTTAAAICGTAYGMTISSWIADIDIVTTIMIPLDLLFFLMAGTFYNLR